MDQQVDQHLPLFDLPSKILCKVVNVELRVSACSRCQLNAFRVAFMELVSSSFLTSLTLDAG
jgi:hypothetical protein